MSNEKRRHDRLPIEAPVEIRAADNTLLGTVRDLSLSGIFVASGQLLPVDTTCQIEIIMHTGAQELRIKGQTRVARLQKNEETGESGMGFSFIEAEEE
jgi:c-di-GMP-binding flagellar brake protein YcgR